MIPSALKLTLLFAHVVLEMPHSSSYENILSRVPCVEYSKMDDTLQQDSNVAERGPKINDFNFTNFTQI